MMNRYFLVICACVLVLVSCSKDPILVEKKNYVVEPVVIPSQHVSDNYIAVYDSCLVVDCGQMAPLPIAISDGIKVNYTSKDENIASVDSNGNVKGVGMGIVEVSASFNDSISKSFSVAVADASKFGYSRGTKSYSSTYFEYASSKGDGYEDMMITMYTSRWNPVSKITVVFAVYPNDVVEVSDIYFADSDLMISGSLVIGRVSWETRKVSPDRKKMQFKFSYSGVKYDIHYDRTFGDVYNPLNDDFFQKDNN